MPTYNQIPIRCRLSIVSNPPVSPIDDNTGSAPKFWRAQAIGIAVGIFDASNESVDLSNLASIQLTFRSSPTSPSFLVTKVVDASDIIPVVSYVGWSTGIAQQAMFSLDSGETDFSLDGLTQLAIWMDIRGFLSDGTPIVYGAGWINVYNSGLAIPTPTTLIRNRTTVLSDTDIKALPTTPKVLVPAPGTGRVLIPLWAVIQCSPAAGAYANVAGARLVLLLGSAETSIGLDAAGVLADIDPFVAQLSSPALKTTGFSGAATVAAILTTLAENLPIKLSDVGASGGDYTGGNPVNTLKITVFYQLLELA